MAMSLGLILSGRLWGQQKPASFSVDVKLETAFEKTFDGELTACIEKGLTALPGVHLVEENQDWILSLVSIKVIEKRGHYVGYACSMVLLATLNEGFLSKLGLNINADLSHEDREKLKTFLHSYHGFEDHFLTTTGRSKLNELCGQVVNRFDQQHYKPVKKAFRRFQQP